MTLTVFAATVVVFALIMYVLLDGFDLGVGNLVLTTFDETERDAMVESIAPVWDGNETWLILLGVTLLAAFPLAYSTILPALYLPVMIMLLALGFRGVSFEFRAQATRNRRYWDYAFCSGSVIASLCQGLMLGGVLSGVPTNGMESAGEVSVFSVFGIMIAISTAVAYTMLGAAWLNWRTEGRLQQRAAWQMQASMLAFAALACAVVTWVLYTDSRAGQTWREIPILSVVFGALAVALWLISWSSIANKQGRARVFSMLLVALFLVGIVITVWPYIVPYSITIWEASAPSSSQQLLMTGVVIMLPMVLANTIYVYWTFRRKPPVSAGSE